MSDQAPVVPPEIQVHEAFNFADSDVMLRSSDGVLFRVHKAHLAAHSLFFEDMFAHGQNTPEDEGGIPCFEKAVTLGVLLTLCYPVAADDPQIDLGAMNFSELLDCYEASRKYDMWLTSQLISYRLLPHVHEDPLTLLRVAYTFREKEMGARAAEAAIGDDLMANVNAKREKAGAAWPALVSTRNIVLKAS